MKALNFIKKTNKKVLNKDEIDNDVYDDKKHNYQYYYNKMCIEKVVNKGEEIDKKTFIGNFLPDDVDNIDLPVCLDNYKRISIFKDIIINYPFKNIKEIQCCDLTINNKMENLEIIESNIKSKFINGEFIDIQKYNKIIINNEITNLKQININNNLELIFNYPNKNIIKYKVNVDGVYKTILNTSIIFINNTNEELKFRNSKFYTKGYYLYETKNRYTKEKPLIIKPKTKNIITHNVIITKIIK